MTIAAPPTFGDIIGQDQAVALLHSAIASGRIHHAWIFSGPVGVGKLTTATAFAAMLLDPTTAPNLAGQYEADPASETRRLISSGAHPDLHIITKELAAFSEDRRIRESKQITIPKEVIETQLLGPISRAASIRSESLASKVFIVDEAELMDRSRTNAPVQNSILKTLEEPPPGSVIILVTSSEDRLLPTIRSRCQRVAFRRLTDEDMDRVLTRFEIELDGESIAWVKEFAQGSPGRALLAIQTGLIEWRKALELPLRAVERGVFDADLGTALGKLVDEWAANWVKDHKNASKEAANHAGAAHMFSLLAERQRKKLEQAASSGAREDMDRALAEIDSLVAAQRHIGANVNMGFSFENLIAQWAER